MDPIDSQFASFFVSIETDVLVVHEKHYLGTCCN